MKEHITGSNRMNKMMKNENIQNKKKPERILSIRYAIKLNGQEDRFNAQ